MENLNEGGNRWNVRPVHETLRLRLLGILSFFKGIYPFAPRFILLLGSNRSLTSNFIFAAYLMNLCFYIFASGNIYTYPYRRWVHQQLICMIFLD